MQASDRSPARMIVDAIPKKGRGKYDFLRQLASDLITSRHGPETSDPVWNLLHRVKESQALGGHPSLQTTCPKVILNVLCMIEEEQSRCSLRLSLQCRALSD